MLFAFGWCWLLQPSGHVDIVTEGSALDVTFSWKPAVRSMLQELPDRTIA